MNYLFTNNQMQN